jgi:hypothetical protein
VKLIRRIEDWLLALLQRRCTHPEEMVAVDILEGMMDDWHVSYCRRCGAVRPEKDWRFIESHRPWRNPDPHLWRNFKSDPVRLVKE